MSGGCTLRPYADATRNSMPSRRNGPATASRAGKVGSPMTGQELRTQLLLQRQCNSPVAWGSTGTDGDATPCNSGAPDRLPPVNDAGARRWRVGIGSNDPTEVVFTPEATRAEVAALYPGALIESLLQPAARSATPAEADELRRLVAVVAADWPEDQRAGALAAALADPAAALMSYRLLAAETADRARHKDRMGSP